MRRLTTPTHIFTLPFPASDCKHILVTYSQGAKKILDKTLKDMQVNGNTVELRLTQEDTKLFSPLYDINIQIRVFTEGNDALASNIMRISVLDVLNDEVFV